jgi:hypothetical protein
VAAAEIVRLAPDAPLEKIITAINALADATLGNVGARQQFKGYDGVEVDPVLGTTVGTGRYSMVVQNSGANHVQVRNAADNADVLTVTDTSVASNAAASFNAGLASTSISGTSLTIAGRIQGKLSVSAICSGALALGGAFADVPGCAVALSVGDWAVMGVFDVAIAGAGDIGAAILGKLVTVGGAATIEPPLTTYTISPVQPIQCTVERTWIVRVTAGTTVKMQAMKGGGGGTSSIGINSSITAINA